MSVGFPTSRNERVNTKKGVTHSYNVNTTTGTYVYKIPVFPSNVSNTKIQL